MNPKILIGEIAVVILLSNAFRVSESWARRRFQAARDDIGVKILDAFNEEITSLGFVGLFLFLVTNTGAADWLAVKLCKLGTTPGVQLPLAHTFEMVHMTIFLLLLVLLSQAIALYSVVRRLCRRWVWYEQIRTFGTSDDSLEEMFVKAGYVKRTYVDDAASGNLIENLKLFEHERELSKWNTAFTSDNLILFLTWRAYRHEFLFPKKEHPHGGAVFRVPDPALCSFELYLRSRLGKTVVGLLEVDSWTSLSTLTLVTLLTYSCVGVGPNVATAVIFSVGFAIIGVALGTGLRLQREVFDLAPILPKDPRKILRLLSGTSMQQLRSRKLPGAVSVSFMSRRYRPELGGVDRQEFPELEMPRAFRRDAKTKLISSKVYGMLFRLLVFFQAVYVTGLIVSAFTVPADGGLLRLLRWLSWLEWPLFLFGVMPVNLRRLTIRNSIELEKDVKLIRKMTVTASEGLFDDFRRLMRLVAFEKQACVDGKAWTQPDAVWTPDQAADACGHGMNEFFELPPEARQGIRMFFAGCDLQSVGSADPQLLQDCLFNLGLPRPDVSRIVRNLIRLVDATGDRKLTWDKFRAMFGQVSSARSLDTMSEVIAVFFRRLDANNDGTLSLREIANGFQKMGIALDMDTLATLLFVRFGKARTALTLDEFTAWVDFSNNGE